MPLRSPLNPELIAGNSPASLDSFQNFITGGSQIGQSVISGASTEDFGFQKASVKPITPDINSIVNTISSNVQNELNSTIQNITNLVDRRVDDRIKDNNKLLVRQVGNVVERKESNITNLQNSIRNIQQENTKVIQNMTGDLQQQIDQVKGEKERSPLGSSMDSYNIMNEVNQMIQQATNITNRGVDRKIRDSNLGITNQIQQVRQAQGSQVTQVQNTLQNVRQETTNLVQKLSGDYQKKINEIDSSKPTNILDKFLDTYNNALGFIQFFANKKNVDALRQNLKNLVTSFTESFEVAKLVRRTIFKIVSQLSNLPKASPGRSGGINLDVGMPRQTPTSAKPKGRGMGRLMRRLALPVLGAGAAIAGTGAAVNALEGAPEVEKQDQQFNFLDSLNGIVSDFSEMITGFLRKPDDDKTSQTPGSAQPAPSRPDDTTGSTDAGENLAAFTATLEASGLQNQADVMQVMLNRVNNPDTPYGDLFGQVTQREQFTPASAMIYDTPSQDKNAERVYGPIKAKLGRTPEERIKKLKELASGPGGIQRLVEFTGVSDASNAAEVLKQFKNDTAVAAKSRDFVGNLIQFRGYPDGKRRGPGGNYFFMPSGKVGKLSPATIDPNATGGFELDERGLQRAPEVIETISQPPPSQVSSGGSNVVPIDLSGMSPQGGSSGGSAPAISSKQNDGPSVPIITPSDTENFLTMYSRLTYNIVDG